MPIHALDEIRTLCTAVLEKTGMREGDIKITLDHYLENEFSGKRSHGLVRVVEAAKYLHKHGASLNDPEITQATESSALINANGQTGPVAGFTAVQKAIHLSQNQAISFVGITNYIINSGSMAYYLRHMTRAGLIAIMGTNSLAMVAPPGGKKPRLGTNPLGIGIPGKNDKNSDDMIADFGTDAMAYGKMMVARDKGEPLPDNVLMDKNGNPTNDPNNALSGAILPLAGYKGFSIALMIELLAGALIGGKSIKHDIYDGDGIFIIAINPEKLGNAAFSSQAADIFEIIRATEASDPDQSIAISGERSAKTLKETIDRGTHDVVENTYKNLQALAEG